MTEDRTRQRLIRRLYELVEALDRRVPDLGAVGETAIANEAATLRLKALARLAELEAAVREGDTAGTRL